MPTFSTMQVKQGVSHHIITKGPLVKARVRCLPLYMLAVANAKFKQMADMGIIRRSSSQFSSPLNLVDMSDGSKRPCRDFRRLNKATMPDRYPVPHIQDFLANLAGKSIFSKVDLVRGYYQVPMAPEDIPKTAISLSVCGNLHARPLASKMQHRPSIVSWTQSGPKIYYT